MTGRPTVYSRKKDIKLQSVPVENDFLQFVPEVALLVEALSREAGAAADVEDHAGLLRGQGEQLEGALGHLTLDLHHSSAAIAMAICYYIANTF